MVFHVRIDSSPENSTSVTEVATDLSRDEVETNFVLTYKHGDLIYINGRWVVAKPDMRMVISESEVQAWDLLTLAERTTFGAERDNISSTWRQTAATRATDVTRQFISGPAGYEPRKTHTVSATAGVALVEEVPDKVNLETDRRSVFIVHGWNEAARDAMAAFLRSLGLRPLTWEHAVQMTGSSAPETLEVVRKGLSAAQATVILMTGDDEVKPALRFRHRDSSSALQPRPNVLVEIGMALAIKPEKTVLVAFESLRTITDIQGLNYLRIDNSAPKRRSLLGRLETAGCPIHDDGSYLNSGEAGDFDAAVKPP